MSERRVDPVTGTVVHVVGQRQGRPNLPDGCPFCVGGLEAPDAYDVRHFPNRWPAMDGGRCEVVLYTPDHEATFASLGAAGARRVIDRWSERTAALGARDDVDFVLVFENRGREVGATIDHPHGQIYAYDHVPARPARRLAGGWRPDPAPGERCVVEADGWRAWVPPAPTFPVSLEVAPDHPVPDLPSMDDHDRNVLASVLVDVLARLDRLYDTPLPYMLWLNQRPTTTTHPIPPRPTPRSSRPRPQRTDQSSRPRPRKTDQSSRPRPRRTGGFDEAWFNVEIVSPWRAPGVPRFIAAAEVACEEFFNPVVPEDLAARLRALS